MPTFRIKLDCYLHTLEHFILSCRSIEKACDGECPCSGSFNMGYFPLFVPQFSDEGFNPVCSTEGNQFNNMQALKAA